MTNVCLPASAYLPQFLPHNDECINATACLESLTVSIQHHRRPSARDRFSLGLDEPSLISQLQTASCDRAHRLLPRV